MHGSFYGSEGPSIKTFREPATITRISARVPDIVITLLGGNDLDGKSPTPPEAVGAQLGRLGDELLALGGPSGMSVPNRAPQEMAPF